MKSNRGSGWISLVLWFFGIMVFFVIVAAIVFPILMHHHTPSPRVSCLNNLMHLGTALNMYKADWGDRFPPLYTTRQSAPEGKAWPYKLAPYFKNKRILRCPLRPDRLTYSFNRRLSGIPEEKIAQIADTVVIFESVSDSPGNNNLNGDQVCRPPKDRFFLPGQYIMWPKDTRKLQRYWPTWARPNHDDITNVIYADGHAKGVPWSQEPRLSPK